MNDYKKIFVEFTKKDDNKRLVGGYVSTETLDSQGEIVEKDAVVKALPGYLGQYDEKTGRYLYGNIREMHQMSAVGKTIRTKVDDRGVYVEGKVVDDNAWKKVKEGVYAGFSIGGRVLEQVKNRIKAIRLSEISLVDRPANPDAVFAMVKLDKAGKLVDVQSTMQLQSPTGSAVSVNYEDPEKQMERPSSSYSESDHPSVVSENDCLTDTQIILQLAQDIRNLLNVFEYNGKPTADLERALNILKGLAAKILTREEDKKKFEIILYAISPEEINKAKLPYRNRKDMPKSDFAYIDSKGEKHLPIHDQAHVRNAMARFGQTQFEDQEKKVIAAKKILAAARRYGIEIDPKSMVASVAEKAVEINITNYVNTNWTPGYFEQMKKVMG